MDNLVSTILITVVILVVVFLILREVICWYWKINERISLQKEQNLILNKILQEFKNKYSLNNNSDTKEVETTNSSNEETARSSEEKHNEKTIVSKKILKSFNYDKGILEIEIFEINGIPSVGDNVYLNGQPAPDGKYKIKFMWYIHVKYGVISKVSLF